MKGTSNFKTAEKRAQSGNRDGAGDLWKQESASSDRTLAGRGYYNMAIIYEINGDLLKYQIAGLN
ncbi:MAG: DUF6340 family protein [Flavihumibacter sp.]